MDNNSIQFLMDNNKSSVSVILGDESVKFSMVYYKKGKDNHDVQASLSPFLEFNEWLKTKPHDWHLNVFNIYKEIRTIINETHDVENLLDSLNKKFIKIYNCISLEEIKEWIVRPNTPIQVSIKNNNNYDKETTYAYDDYLELVVFSFALRFVAPIWSDIYNRLNNEYGKDAKEVYSMEILYDTCMSSNVKKGYICHAEERLKEFIANTKTKIETNAVVISGLSEDDFYNYLYSVIVLKKISQGVLSTTNGQYHLIAQTYFFLNNKIKQASKSYGDDTTQIQVKKNPIEDRSGNESNSQSILDIGFVRSRLLTDEKVFLRNAINDHKRLIEVICPDLPENLYWESMGNIKEMDKSLSSLSYLQHMKPIQEVQLTITKWLVHDVVNTVIFDYLELDEVINLIGLIRAIYWYKGFYEFSAIISSVAIPSTEDIKFMQPSYRKDIETNIANKMDKIYNLGGNTKSDKKNMSYRGCIDIITKQINEYHWKLTLPESWLSENHLVHVDKFIVIPSDIRNRICNLMLYVESRQKIVKDDFGF